MLQIIIEKSFKKDIKRDKKSGNYSNKDFEILKSIITSLQNHLSRHSCTKPEDELLPKYKRHTLKGKMEGFESVHIKNDWLLIFKTDIEYLKLIMLGKHTQAYKKFT